MENEYTTSDVIDYSLDGDMTNLQAAVNGIMGAKVAEILSARKIEVAKNLFSQED